MYNNGAPSERQKVVLVHNFEHADGFEQILATSVYYQIVTGSRLSPAHAFGQPIDRQSFPDPGAP